MTAIKRVFDLLDHYQDQSAPSVMVAGKAEGKWISYSPELFFEIVHDLSKGLLELGLKKGDRIALISANRPEWNFVDFAVNQIGAAIVPLYPTLSDADLHYIIEDADVKLVFVGDQQLVNKITVAMEEKKLEHPIYCFDRVAGEKSWKELVDLGKASSISLDSYRNAVKEDDLLTLIYTSGTTGRPKGVPLSHKNLISNFTNCADLLPANYKKALSFLPLCHIFERMVVYMYFYKRISIYYAENLDTVVADINEVHPNGFTTVPRVLEKVYDKIVEKGEAQKGWKKSLFFWALALGLTYREPGRNNLWYRMKVSVARVLIFKKWRAALGGEIVVIICGGAALQQRLARVFWAAGIPVLEGYGLTETSPVIAVNNLEPNGLLFGSVGRVLKSVSVKIAEDGEILCKGPSVFKGYYKNEKATAEAFDKDGYFKTGDIGELTDAGFLRITDRKKEMFKTAGGKYVAPQVLENKLMESTFIAHVMVLGEGRKFPSALIVPAFDELQKWAKRKGVQMHENEDLIHQQQVLDYYQRIVDQANHDFGHWEQVKKFVLLPHEWSVAGGELTPKLSLKRKVIAEKYQDRIDGMYEEGE